MYGSITMATTAITLSSSVVQCLGIVDLKRWYCQIPWKKQMHMGARGVIAIVIHHHIGWNQRDLAQLLEMIVPTLGAIWVITIEKRFD
jgi:hypothetical protein